MLRRGCSTLGMEVSLDMEEEVVVVVVVVVLDAEDAPTAGFRSLTARFDAAMRHLALRSSTRFKCSTLLESCRLCACAWW